MQSRGLESRCFVPSTLHGHPIHFTLCTDMPVRLGSGSAFGYSSRARVSRTILFFFVPLWHPQRSIQSARPLTTKSAMSISSSRAEIGAGGEKLSFDDSVSTFGDESIEGSSAGEEVGSDELEEELGKSHNTFFVLPSVTASGFNYICSSTHTNPEMR